MPVVVFLFGKLYFDHQFETYGKKEKMRSLQTIISILDTSRDCRESITLSNCDCFPESKMLFQPRRIEIEIYTHIYGQVTNDTSTFVYEQVYVLK